MAGFVLGGTSLNEFRDYCAMFYGDRADSVYGDSFDGGPFTVDEIHAAALFVANVFADSFEGDSVDRERLREVVLFGRAMRDVGSDGVAARLRGVTG